MLSIGAMGAGQGNYYLDLAREDYYLEGGEPPGKWYGRGAEELGLIGTVEKEALRNLLLGVLPTGDRPLIQNAGAKNHQPGWDLTFSAPKSVSALWAVASFETRWIIQEAHYQSVITALEYLEEEAAFTRRGKGGYDIEAACLIIATFEHGTSRSLDPQLHTHALILNIATRRDGTSGTIQSKPFYDHKMTAGALFRLELSAELKRRLGLECERQRTWFEVKGIPKGLTNEFSKRRIEIEGFLGSRRLTSASASAYATLATREVKIHAPRSELFPKWKEIGLAHGFSQKEAELLLQRRSARNVENKKRETIWTAIEKIIVRESHFSRKSLLRVSAEEAQGTGIGALELRSTVKDLLASSERIISLGRTKGELCFALREAAHNHAENRAEVLHAYAEQGLLTVTEDRHAAIRVIVSDWKAAGSDPKKSLILATTKQEAQTLNRLIQNERRNRDELGQTHIAIGSEIFHAGDRILFIRNSRLYGVKKGSLGSIEEINTEKQAIQARIDNGDRRTIDLDHYEHIRLGYSVTTREVYGATVENLFVLVVGRIQDRDFSYEQAWNVSGVTRFYIDRIEAGENLTTLVGCTAISHSKELAVSLQLKPTSEPNLTF